MTSEQVVCAYIERIKEVNPIINAVVEDRFEAAIEDAKRADRLVQTTSELQLITNYPILGVPFTVKESCSLNGKLYIKSHVIFMHHKSSIVYRSTSKTLLDLFNRHDLCQHLLLNPFTSSILKECAKIYYTQRLINNRWFGLRTIMNQRALGGFVHLSILQDVQLELSIESNSKAQLNFRKWPSKNNGKLLKFLWKKKEKRRRNKQQHFWFGG